MTRPATERVGVAALAGSVLALWLQGWAPNLVSLLTSGRGYISGLESTVERSALAQSLSSLLATTALGLIVAAIVLGLPSIVKVRPAPYILLISAWLILYPWHGMSGVNPATIIFPALVIAWMLLRPPAQTFYGLFAWIGVVTAALSMGFGLMSPLAFMPAQWTLDADKALLGGSILAGPYSHSNALGLSLVLTLPFVATHFARKARFAALAIVAVALLWSASRLSTAAAALTMILSLCAIYMPEIRARRLLSFTAVVSAVVVVALPLTTTDPSLFTNRGRIWMASLAYAPGEFWLGHGWDVFRTIDVLTTSLGFVSTTGHNIFVTLFVAGGFITVMLLAIAGVVAYRNGRFTFPVDRTRLLFLCVLLIVSVAEDPTRAFYIAPQSFVIYAMFIIMLDTTQQPSRAKEGVTALSTSRAMAG